MSYVKAEKYHSPEERAVRAQIFNANLQNSGTMPNFLSDDLRRNYVDTLTTDGFVAWLKDVNGVLTSDDLQPSDFTDDVAHVEERALSGETHLQIMPAPEDKEELLGYVLTAAQSADDMETKAMIVGFGINAVHPFKDGNGRTSRVVYTLLSQDYEPGSAQIKKAIVDRESTELVLAPSIFSRSINSFLGEQTHSTVRVGDSVQPKVLVRVENPIFNDIKEYATPRRETTYDEMQKMINIFGDATVGPIVAHFLELKATYRSVRSSLKDYGPRQKVFFVDTFLTNASDEEVDMAYQFYREVTLARVKMLVDVLAGRQYTDVLVAGRSKLNETYSFQEFGRRAANGAMLSGLNLNP